MGYAELAEGEECDSGGSAYGWAAGGDVEGVVAEGGGGREEGDVRGRVTFVCCIAIDSPFSTSKSDVVNTRWAAKRTGDVALS